METEEPKNGGLGRNVVALGWVAFFGGLSQDMILPILPTFYTAVLGMTPEFIGLIEGSLIARQIVSALVEKRIKVFFVTHLYTLARGFHDKGMADAVFLVAERRADGERTFRIIEGEPSQTSYGEDLYTKIFGTVAEMREAHE